jgi:hypothetical protein
MPPNPDASPVDELQPWATPIRDGKWDEPGGTTWHMRGAELRPRFARRLLRRPGVRVLHACGPEAHLIEGDELDAVVERLREFLEGKAQPHADFRVADFRDDDHHVLAVIEEPR